MTTVTVDLRSIVGTEAALGWSGGHTVVVDRAEGRAGGMGLGFNGAQLLGLAAGGCFCNDSRYAAHELGFALQTIEVSVTVELEGQPLLVAGVTIRTLIETTDGSDPEVLIKHARDICTVANSLNRGVPVRFA